MARRLPVYILIDTSGSMQGESIESVKIGLADMIASLQLDSYALETVCISIITYDKEVKQILPLTALEDLQMPDISVPESEPTFMGAALKLLCERYDAEANNMKNVILILLLFCSRTICSAQSCYNETRSKGISLYNQKKYKEAINVFEAAKDCPDKPSAHDLNAMIKNCRDAISAQEEKRRQEQEEERRNCQRIIAANQPPVNIQKAEFCNAVSGEIIDSWGATLYASKMKYMYTRITYDNPSNTARDVEFYIKLYEPDGALMSGTSSPEGYTYSSNISIKAGNNNSIELGSWRNKEGNTFSTGKFLFEIWHKGKKLYKTAITLFKQSNEATRLTVNSFTAATTRFKAEADTETYYVSTDADSYETWGIPSWCSITNQTSISFTLRCERNPSTAERKDYMKVNAGEKTVKIDIIQAGNANLRNCTIGSVWTEHNYWQGRVKGMLIHSKFTINNMVSRKAVCAAYFQFGNGTKDFNYLYRSVDGQVCVSEIFTPLYQSTVFNDFKLFLPYTELHMNSGTVNASLRFYILIYDNVTEEDLTKSDYVTFTFSN